MYDVDKLKKELVRDEGIKLLSYRDTEGNWTVGVGHLLSLRNTPRPRIDELTMDEAMAFLDLDIRKAERTATDIFPMWKELDPVRQRVVINMAFNLGNRLSGFKNFLASMKLAVVNRDPRLFEEAALHMMNSKWAIQVKGRADRLVSMMKTGTDA